MATSATTAYNAIYATNHIRIEVDCGGIARNVPLKRMTLKTSHLFAY